MLAYNGQGILYSWTAVVEGAKNGLATAIATFITQRIGSRMRAFKWMPILAAYCSNVLETRS